MKIIENLKKSSAEEKVLWIAIPAAAFIIIVVFVEYVKMSAKENRKD